VVIVRIFNIATPAAEVIQRLIKLKDVKVGEKVNVLQGTVIVCFNLLKPSGNFTYHQV
jgi:hypothetical protein